MLTGLAAALESISWAVLVARALALFDTVALLWLGLTVLLNAERRNLGTWLTAGGLLAGGLVAAAHAGRLGAEGPLPIPFSVDWWRLTWLPLAGTAYLWGAVMAWYANRLQTPVEWGVLAALTALGIGVFALLVVRVPFVVAAAARRGYEADPAGLAQTGATAVLVAYVAFAMLAVGLALLALWRPRAPERFMGELAFRRARPWLGLTSVVVLLLALAIGLILAGPPIARPIELDVAALGLLGLQVALTGRAVVSYEVFTGKPLPRGGLARHWKNSLLLAAGFGASVALSLELPIGGIVRLVIATTLVALFYALVSWRTFAERERTLDRLRPFVAGRGAAGGVLATGSSAPDAPAGDRDAVRTLAEPFRALCDDVLGARVAYLCPLGSLAPLVGPALAHPPTATDRRPSSEALAELAALTDSPRDLCLPLDAAQHGGASWAVPLWGERGLVGLLLLGDRRDGGLYTQEEIEIARATGERLIDARATAELARRLVLLQRRRLAEDQVLDGRARRALHDDVLPLLHAALLALSGAAGAPAGGAAEGGDGAGRNGGAHGRGAADRPDAATLAGGGGVIASEARRSRGPGPRADAHAAPPSSVVAPAPPPTRVAMDLLTDAHRQIVALLRELPSALGPEVARLGLFGAVRRAAEDQGGQFAGIAWRIEPAAEDAARRLSPLAAEVLFGAAREAIRNAGRHARGRDANRAVRLTIAARVRDGLELAIEDDGVGLDTVTDRHGTAGPSAGDTGEAVTAPMRAARGAPTEGARPPRGGGQGLLLHGTLLATLGGGLLTEQASGGGTRVTLRVPLEG